MRIFETDFSKPVCWHDETETNSFVNKHHLWSKAMDRNRLNIQFIHAPDTLWRSMPYLIIALGLFGGLVAATCWIVSSEIDPCCGHYKYRKMHRRGLIGLPVQSDRGLCFINRMATMNSFYCLNRSTNHKPCKSTTLNGSDRRIGG